IAPRPSRPTTWNVFLPISIPITAVTLGGFSVMGVLLSLSASVSLSLIRQEHGPTIPLSVFSDFGKSLFQGDRVNGPIAHRTISKVHFGNLSPQTNVSNLDANRTYRLPDKASIQFWQISVAGQRSGIADERVQRAQLTTIDSATHRISALP